MPLLAMPLLVLSPLLLPVEVAFGRLVLLLLRGVSAPVKIIDLKKL
jgi:hypothetical protein